MKKLLLLITVLLVFLGCNSQSATNDDDVVVEEEVELEEETYDDYPFDSTTTVGDLEWIGRVIESENDQEDNPTYQLVKVDKEGNETIMYESVLESLFPIISLKSDQSTGGNNLILEHYQGYPEGGGTITVFFNEGEESVRAMTGSFWGFIQQFAFKYPDSAEYQVELETSNECSDYIGQMELTEDMETDILGLEITSEGNTEIFELSSPKRVSCITIDGSVIHPVLREGDVQVNKSGVSVKLPGSIEAYISRGDSVNKLSVNYR
jgi:hypothetical protein